MFSDDWKYDEQGNLLQVEIQQLMVQIDHRHFCSTADSGNLLEEEENFVENTEISEKCPHFEADCGRNISGLHQQPAHRLHPGHLPAHGVPLHHGGAESHPAGEHPHQTSPASPSHSQH